MCGRLPILKSLVLMMIHEALEKLAEVSDVITYEFENIDVQRL